MVGVLIVTHSPLAKALLESSQMIIGEDIKQCCAHTLILGQDMSDFEGKFNVYLDTLDDGDGVLVMVDLFAGTPANVAMRSMKDKNFECLSGVNLGMVVEALTSRNYLSLNDVKKAALEAGKLSIVDIREKIMEGGK